MFPEYEIKFKDLDLLLEEKMENDEKLLKLANTFADKKTLSEQQVLRVVLNNRRGIHRVVFYNRGGTIE